MSTQSSISNASGARTLRRGGIWWTITGNDSWFLPSRTRNRSPLTVGRWPREGRRTANGERSTNALNHHRLRSHRHLFRAGDRHCEPLHQAREALDARLLRLASLDAVVARRNSDGGDDLLRRHAARGDRDGGEERRRRQLALVVDAFLRNVDGVLLRATVAARGGGHRCRADRAALCREARRISPRLSR